MIRQLSIKHYLCCLLLSTIAVTVNAQTITDWSEQGGPLALGYPVPIPVDTPVPFDGFRSYSGLQSQWQSIDLDNPWINAHQVGTSHKNRQIWAYVMSDDNNLTPWGQPEAAMMINGGIHAREWQSPETLTGILELFHANSNDRSLYQYLLENNTIITIPVLNVDGFLQTQRYPKSNWFSNAIGPRDGRMRRKNLRDTDEILDTNQDYLNGVDLNRNNPPYWASSNRSSPNPTSIVYHGLAAQSEPEAQALLNAADLVNPDQLRIYTDLHSFSQVHFANRSFNNTLNFLQSRVLSNFSRHHKALPGEKNYVDRSAFTTPGFGIGSTDEYFQTKYQIPAWTLETEPSNTLSPDAHPDLPGFAADYGGVVSNGHSGFISPDSAIRRIRTQLAQSFAIAWYTQSGPPAILQYQIIDNTTDAIIVDAAWDANLSNSSERTWYQHSFAPLVTGENYSLLIRFNKPMRHRDNNQQIAHLPGFTTLMNPIINTAVNNLEVNFEFTDSQWLNQQSSHWQSYGFYQDDTWVGKFSLPEPLELTAEDQLNFEIIAFDMVGQSNDSHPATAVTWAQGQWQNYENSSGVADIKGGFDTSLSVPLAVNASAELELPHTALYYDPARNGEGFSLELLNENADYWLQWFTYDEEAEQQWYVAGDNKAAANALIARSIYTVNDGIFGPDYDPQLTAIETAGTLEFIFDGPAGLEQKGYAKYHDLDTGLVFRFVIEPFTEAKGFTADLAPTTEFNAAALTGSWYNPDRVGEGFHLQILNNETAVMQWFSFSPDGDKKWFVASGGLISYLNASTAVIEFNDVADTRGGLFGADFNPDDVVIERWGNVRFQLACDGGQMSYISERPEYGSGGYALVRLTASTLNSYKCP